MAFLDNLDDPQKQALLAAAAGLLSGQPGRGNFMGDVSRGISGGLLGYNQASAQERANRANDLQQLQGLANVLQQREPLRMLQFQRAGKLSDYTPDPALTNVYDRIAKLSGAGNLGQNDPTAQAAPPPMPSAPTLPAAQASQYSPVVNPEFQAKGPMPSPQAAPSSAALGTSGIGAPAGGVPAEVWLSQPGGFASYLKQLAEDNKAVSTRYGIFMPQRSAADGPVTNYLAVGGALPQGAMPYTMGPDGKPAVGLLPNQAATVAALAGIPAEAKAQIERRYGTFMQKGPGGVERPVSTESTVPMPSSLFLTGGTQGQPPQTVRPASGPLALPPQNGGLPVASQPTPTPPNSLGLPLMTDKELAALPKVIPTTGPQTTEQATVEAARGSKRVELASQYGQEAAAAGDRIATMQQAAQELPHATTGYFGPALGTAASALAGIIPESLAPTLKASLAGSAAANETLTKALANIALNRGKQMFGNKFTQGEVGIMLNQANPSPRMQETAIRFLLDTEVANAKYQIARSIDYSRAGNAVDPLSFQGSYAAQKPVAAFMPNLEAYMGKGQQPAQQQSVDDLVKRYRTR